MQTYINGNAYKKLYFRKNRGETDQKIVSGYNIVLDDSNRGHAQISLYGKSVQNTVPGNQLANLPDVEPRVEQGITWSCKNGAISVEGTAAPSSSYSSFTGLYYDVPIVAGQYCISGTNSDVLVRCNVTSSDGSTVTQENTFTLDGTETRARIFCCVVAGKTVNATLYPMLNAGTEPLPWEPYVGGIPSPNPAYPQEIRNAGRKNLLKNTAESQTINGGTVTVNEDGSIVINGTFSTLTYVDINTNFDSSALAGMLFSGVPNGLTSDTNGSVIVRISASDRVGIQDIYTNNSKIIDNGQNLIIAIRIPTGYTCNNLTFKPMIRRASIANDTYVPYGKMRVKVVGKNLFDENAYISTGDIGTTGSEFANNNRSLVGVNVLKIVGTGTSRRWYIWAIEASTSYALSFSGNVSNNYYIGLADMNGVGTRDLSVYATAYATTKLFTTSSEETYLLINADSTSNIQLEKGTVSTSYEPYTENSIFISAELPGIPVSDASLATYTDEDGQMWCADYIDAERGVRVQRTQEKIIDADDYSSINLESGTTSLFRIVLKEKLEEIGYTPVLCDQFKSGLSYNEINEFEGCMIGLNGSSNVIAKIPSCTTVGEVIDFIEANPITVRYILATPIETPLTTEEIIALNSLRTYDGTTHLFVDSDVEPWMEVEYNALISEAEYVPYKKVFVDGVQVYSAGNPVTYYVDSGTVYTEEVEFETSCLIPKTFTPSKDGYTFLGWRQDTTASGDVLTEKVMGDEPVTLYAVFSKTVTLSYSGNGATSGSVSAQKKTAYYNNGKEGNPTFTLAANGFTRTNYTFNYWDWPGVGTFQPGETIQAGSDVTLYAAWAATKINKKISFSGKSQVHSDLSANSADFEVPVTNASITWSVQFGYRQYTNIRIYLVNRTTGATYTLKSDSSYVVAPSYSGSFAIPTAGTYYVGISAWDNASTTGGDYETTTFNGTVAN